MANRKNQRANKKARKESYTQLSAIMKGVIVYRTEVEEMYALMKKYPVEVRGYWSATA